MQNYVYEKLFCYILFKSTPVLAEIPLVEQKPHFRPFPCSILKTGIQKPFWWSYLRIVVIDYNYHITTNISVVAGHARMERGRCAQPMFANCAPKYEREKFLQISDTVY